MEVKLIRAVKRRPWLYDTSHEDYMKSKLKLDTWDDIAEEIRIKSGSHAKISWEKLRHAYRDALRRQNKNSRSADAGFKQWKFQNEMKFLQPYTTKKKGDFYISDTSEATSPNYQELWERIAGEPTEEDVDVGIPSVALEEEDTHIENSYTDNPGNERLSALLKQAIENISKRTAEKAAERSIFLEVLKPPNDALYHFFMSIYETTKNMPLSSQHFIKNHIFKFVNNVEANLLNIPPTQDASQFL